MKKTTLAILICLFTYAAAIAAVDNKYYEENNSHKENGVECVTCHETKNPVVAPNVDNISAVCATCHGTLNDMGKTTAQNKPNPHDTHIGAMDCYECHNIHKPSVNMCASCHTFPMKVR